MKGQEVYDILTTRGVTQLYHANSVRTSISLLKLKGLASRQLVQQKNLPQTIQFTDDIDRRLGVWGDIFLDTVDIHSRASNRNKYGPALFEMSTDFLKELTDDSQVFVTRLNPSKWESMPSAQRYFLTADELSIGLDVGNFDQMITIRTNNGLIPFSRHLKSVILDEPKLPTGVSPEFNLASAALYSTAQSNNIQLTVERRICNTCKCIGSYSEKETRVPFFYSF